MLFADVFKVFKNKAFCIFLGKSFNFPQSVKVPPYFTSSLMTRCDNNVATWKFFTLNKAGEYFEVTRIHFIQSIEN